MEIQLTQGKVAVIDDEDWPLVAPYKWCAHRDRAQKVSHQSEFKGVTWDKNKRCWKSMIKVAGRNRHLGYFDTEEEAAAAYRAAATSHFGAFARF